MTLGRGSMYVAVARSWLFFWRQPVQEELQHGFALQEDKRLPPKHRLRFESRRGE